ncbi:phage tail protein [Pseudomonas veronii]|uniref:phage tail protein n=1 Tax=Pseudomonas veronii TaxID=76761 RepID=UPI0018E7AAD0|nr:phage tail protein [Pseudomonas veronii]
MTDQNTQFFAILTAIGKAKQANADALGIPWTFAQMGVGDANDTDPIPSEQQTQLINERRRAPLNQLSVDPTNPNIIVAEQVIPENVGGWWIREVGLYDADGDLVAVANCAPSFKPLLTQGSGRTQVVRMNLIVSNTANVELKIDPSVVLATRNYVDTKLREELYKLDSKQSVRVATTANIAMAGLQIVDGVTLLAGDRVLVKNQATAKDNGIYVAGSTAWLRAPDADSNAKVTPALIVSVEQGITQADTRWQLVTDGVIVLGTTPLIFQNVTQGFAPLNSPAFQGNPTAPTPAVTDSDTSIATTAFVRNVLARYGLASYGYVWNGNIDLINETGVYTFSDGSSGARPKNPTTGVDIPRGMLLHLERDNTLSALQIWESVNAGVALTFKRSRLSNGAWTAWAQMWDELNTPKQANSADTTVGAMLTVGAFGLGAEGKDQPLITNFSDDIRPGLYRAFASNNAQASIGAPPNTGDTSMSVIVGGGFTNPGYKTFIAIINASGTGSTRAFVGFKVIAGAQPAWTEITQATHLPCRAKVYYKTAGVYQWTVPDSVTKVQVEVVGGGGSGAFGADGSTTTGPGGGGGGGISQRLCTVVPGSVITVTVGAGGDGVSTEGAGGVSGGTSSFGSFCSATGGRSGVMNAGALGGMGSGGDFNASLGMGFPPVRSSGGASNWGGPGGGGESAFAAQDTSILTRPGMGGGGRTKTRSQSGADGCVFITY